MSQVLRVGSGFTLRDAIAMGMGGAHPVPRTPADSVNGRRLAQAKGAVLASGRSTLTAEQRQWNAAVEAKKRERGK